MGTGNLIVGITKTLDKNITYFISHLFNLILLRSLFIIEMRWKYETIELQSLFSYPIPISCCLSQRGLAINLVSQNEPLFYNFENNYNYFIIYLLCNPDISHLITYSTLSGNCDSTSFFRRRSKKGLKTLCKRRIIKIVSSSFNSTFSP